VNQHQQYIENLAEIYRPLIYSLSLSLFRLVQHTIYGTIIESRRLAFVRSAAACVFAQPGIGSSRETYRSIVCCVCLSMMKRTVFFGGCSATTLYIVSE
jgi:hypothetical protein